MNEITPKHELFRCYLLDKQKEDPKKFTKRAIAKYVTETGKPMKIQLRASGITAYTSGMNMYGIPKKAQPLVCEYLGIENKGDYFE